ncbi:uncharacterized protein LOC18025601 isoform X2 [Eutrema salsugineum]|uniref:uncharacterized protein LOC18025601 isoform X2 n=1 Tax=Eutrema salsugineum TaxID=72664 RepID=UPI000CED64A4|nr:uncharacterized protein LOC18025601 isoform X2 [Eutrema salsugineum]
MLMGTRTSELGMINNIGTRAANLVGAGDAVNAQANSQEIQAPAGENYSFEIKAGFINMVQSNKFYGGALPKIRLLLDTASTENVLAQEVNEIMGLVENLAQSDEINGEEYNRASRRDVSLKKEKTRKDIKSLNEKPEKLLLASQKSVNFVGDLHQGFQDNVQCEDITAEVNQPNFF